MLILYGMSSAWAGLVHIVMAMEVVIFVFL